MDLSSISKLTAARMRAKNLTHCTTENSDLASAMRETSVNKQGDQDHKVRERGTEPHLSLLRGQHRIDGD